jgi:hypothetical protein
MDVGITAAPQEDNVIDDEEVDSQQTDNATYWLDWLKDEDIGGKRRRKKRRTIETMDWLAQDLDDMANRDKERRKRKRKKSSASETE